MELVGILAGVFELLAIYLIGIKKKTGFPIGICCNILWVWFVLVTGGSYGLLIVCPAAFVLNIKGYLRWRNDEKKQEISSRQEAVKNR